VEREKSRVKVMVGKAKKKKLGNLSGTREGGKKNIRVKGEKETKKRKSKVPTWRDRKTAKQA